MQKYDSSKDYYEVLGVEEGASGEEINKAYRKEARKRHPDGGGSEDEMKTLNEAHDILSDPAARKAYDGERRHRQPAIGSSIVFNEPDRSFDAEAASRAGTLKIPVQDEDFIGLCMGAATCFVVGLPLLLLVETQWIILLWPLRLMLLGMLGFGVLMAHSALAVKHERLRKNNPSYPRARVFLHEVAFWALSSAVMSLLMIALYTDVFR